MLRVVMQLNMKGKRPRGNTTWLDNIDRQQKGKNTSFSFKRSHLNEMFRE